MYPDKTIGYPINITFTSRRLTDDEKSKLLKHSLSQKFHGTKTDNEKYVGRRIHYKTRRGKELLSFIRDTRKVDYELFALYSDFTIQGGTVSKKITGGNIFD